MKKTTISILLFFLIANIFAQPILDNSIFPIQGDTLKTLRDQIPENIDLGNGGANQYWDFTRLLSPVREETKVQKASLSIHANLFPNADLSFQVDENLERFFIVKKNEIQELGFVGIDPVLKYTKTQANYDPPMTTYRFPMQYGDEYTSFSSLIIPMELENLADSLRGLLPKGVAAVRIRVEVSRLDEVDAWGKLVLSSGTFDVLRQRKIEIREPRLDIKRNTGDWEDITSDLPANSIFTSTESASYHFLSNEVREPIAVVEVDNRGNIFSIEYKAGSNSEGALKGSSGRPDLIAYPNPTYGDLRFYFSNLESGYYKIRIFTIIGKELWSESHYVNKNKTIKVTDLSLGKGSYFYSLLDEKGKTIKTKRLLVITP